MRRSQAPGVMAAVARVERAGHEREVAPRQRTGVGMFLTDAIDVAGLAASEDLAHRLDIEGFGDVRVSDWPVFRLLLANGAVPIGALSRLLGISQQATSKAVFLMECRGYVARVAPTEDQRIREVLLTAQAYDAIDIGAQWATERHAQAVERWGDTQVQHVLTFLIQFADGCDRSEGRGRDLRSGR